MARKPVVSRTIQSTNATILCVNPSTRALEEVSVTLPRTSADDKAVMKKVEKMSLIQEPLKPVSVVSTTVTKKLYKMDEDFYIEHATPCDELDEDEADDEAPETTDDFTEQN